MDQDSLFKRTLVLTGTIAGLSALWVAVVSVVLVFATERAVAGLSNSGANTAATSAAGPNGATTSPAVPRGMFAPAAPITGSPSSPASPLYPSGPKPNG
jgi:hypothetical protein